jgi:hypothetical protein
MALCPLPKAIYARYQSEFSRSELASFASLDEVFSVYHGRGPVETQSICFADQIGVCRVAATLSIVNFSQELDPF